MATSKDFTRIVDIDALSEDVGRVEDLADRVRLAGYGLAAPLVEARVGQMRREVERTRRRKGADHPEVALRQASLDRATSRFQLFAEEMERARISRPSFESATGASVWGRVVDDGKPVPGLTVSAFGGGKRLGFACTDTVGSFALDLPPETDFVLSVRDRDAAELYRDKEATALATGQQLYREIDLTRGPERPCPDLGDQPPSDEAFAMPDLVGRREAAALALLKSQGLSLGQRSTEPVDGTPGLVLGQSPEAGTQVKPGDSVDIVVGVSRQIAVPDLVGLTLERAEALLKGAGLVQGTVKQVPVAGERSGLIVDQSPLPGARVDPGSAVDLSVGVAGERETELIAVPDVTGRSLDNADAQLKNARLVRGSTTEVPVPDEKIGLVVGQSPGAGSKVPVGTTVALIVGRKAENTTGEVKVPDLKGTTRADAEAILEAAGLALGEVARAPSEAASVGRVIAQDPAPGTAVQRGDKVGLVIGVAEEDRVRTGMVPQVIGTKADAAERALEAAGFAAERKARRIASRLQAGIVLDQDPRGDTRAPLGSVVVIFVGVVQVGPNLSAEVTEIAALAKADLTERGGGEVEVAGLLTAAQVATLADLDALLAQDRNQARSRLALRTLAETDRVLAALKRARSKVG